MIERDCESESLLSMVLKNCLASLMMTSVVPHYLGTWHGYYFDKITNTNSHVFIYNLVSDSAKCIMLQKRDVRALAHLSNLQFI